MADNIDNFLTHYGVKGMKWGVRKDRGASSTTPSYAVDSEGRITIEKGYQLQRVFQTGKGGSGEEGANYFSFTERDKKTYLMMMSAGIDSKIGFIRKLASDKVSTMVATEELRSPSRREAFDTLKRTVDEVGSSKGVGKPPKSFSSSDALDWYQEANTRIVLDKNTELSRAFFSNLKKDGYNILLDEMDAGTISDLPIVVLDGGKSLRMINVSDVSGQSVRDAKAFVKSQRSTPIRELSDYSKNPDLLKTLGG